MCLPIRITQRLALSLRYLRVDLRRRIRINLFETKK